MNNQLLVAVSQRVEILEGRNERRDSLDQALCRWLIAAGFLPVPVPNFSVNCSGDGQKEVLHQWLRSVKPGAILLSGGSDIGEMPERDAVENALLAYAREKSMPLLGICRGMQIMAIWSGAELKPIFNHTRTHHFLRGDITGDANSFHNFALSACPPDFRVIAEAEDSSIEAIKHRKLPWEGWMWHPERESEFSDRDINRLKGLFA